MGAALEKKETVLIASDHAGYDFKERLKKLVHSVQWEDLGTTSDVRVDYPDYAAKVAERVSESAVSTNKNAAVRGVLICGSGIGMSIVANKFPGVRAAVVETLKSAVLSRQHNDANIICLGARLLDPKLAAEMTEAWLKTAFEGGRHEGRLQKIAALEVENASGKKRS